MVYDIINSIKEFLSSNIKRGVVLVAFIAVIAIIDFLSLGLARRTFVFYTVSDGIIHVEDRMVKRSGSKEIDLIRYTEEALLGPVAPGLRPLFTRGTRLKTLMFRDGVVYIDLTEDAAMPPIEGGNTKDNFLTLYNGILRNFSFVKEVRFYIEGQAAFSGEYGEGLKQPKKT